MSPLLQELLENEAVEDIVLSQRGLSYYSQNKWTGPRPDRVCEERSLFILSRRIADRSNVTLGLTQPSVDSYIDFNGQYFRAHVVVLPMALEGTEITLRRIPKAKRFSLRDFHLGPSEENQLKRAVQESASILISGVTGSGKSSLLSALMAEIPLNERVLILEDSPELALPNLMSTKLIARSNRFGFREGPEWSLSDLVYESLRMRPDRIVVGECRGPEAKAISQALMTGHRGVMTSLHAGGAKESLERFDILVQGSAPERSFHSSDYWDLLVHIKVLAGAERKITEIVELR